MKHIFLLAWVFTLFNAKAQDPAYPTAPATPQNLVSAEYFFDADPGFGAATAITVTPGVTLTNVAASVNTAGLANGIHRFYLRTRDADGKWSITNVKDFLVDFDPGYPTSPTAPQNLNRAEYFIDTDPGMGNGTAIPITPGTDLPNVAATINTAGLTNGIHRLWLRTQGADGKWSMTNVKDFAVDFDPAYPTPAPVQNITRAEYFVDTDPGFSNGTTIPVSAASNIANVVAAINTAGLPAGVHYLWLRTQGADGKWSITNVKDFLVDFDPAYPVAPAALQTINKAEYFFDTDPGFGNGATIAITPATDISNAAAAVNTTGLSIGVHRIYVRTRSADGKWSISNLKDFLVDENPAYPTPPAAPGNLVYAEYFFDTDPGMGNGTAVTFTPGVTLSNISITANVAALSQGNHKFFLRTLDDWSLTGYQTFLKGFPLPLRLLSFYAKNTDRSVALDWKTDNEIATAYFDVERSGDGLRFTKMGTVRATNGPGVQTYSLNDAQPLEGKGFYRLKQVDKDAKYTYSNVLAVNRSKAIDVQLFPNPTLDKLTVLLPQNSAPQTLALLNAGGQALKAVAVPSGSTTVELSLTGFAAGAYFIKWQCDGKAVVKAFTKQ